MTDKLDITGMILFFYFLGFPLYNVASEGKTKLTGDNDSISRKQFITVEIKSTADEQIQKAIFYQTQSKNKKPLIVYLHSWSGDYKQGTELARKVAELDWNYVSPDFRGPNDRSEACGSPLVLSDIEDAIDYTIKNANVDKKEIHIVGGSGGAYATLLCFMKIKHKIKSFSAWNPITNLVDWYYESLGRQSKYANDIFKATSSKENLNIKEAALRSPVNSDYPGKIRDDSKLFIYHGIHDGYLGSVPITQSLNFYNSLIKKIDPLDDQSLISEQDIMDLLVKKIYPGTILCNEMIGDRKIHYKRNYRNIQIIIFEGKHEMLNDVVMDLIPVKDDNAKLIKSTK